MQPARLVGDEATHFPFGALPFDFQDFLGFALSVVVEGQGDLAMLHGAEVGGGGLSGPVEDGAEGALVELNVGVAERAAESGDAGIHELLWGGELADGMPGGVALPEGGRVLGRGLEIVAHDRSSLQGCHHGL